MKTLRFYAHALVALLTIILIMATAAFIVIGFLYTLGKALWMI